MLSNMSLHASMCASSFSSPSAKQGKKKKKGKSRIVGRGKRLAIIKPVVKVGV